VGRPPLAHGRGGHVRLVRGRLPPSPGSREGGDTFVSYEAGSPVNVLHADTTPPQTLLSGP
jgi:hypothetical protein